MPYDLYGNYYRSARDAENAEMAQCAQIDADINRREVQKLQQRRDETERELCNLRQLVYHLREKVESIY